MKQSKKILKLTVFAMLVALGVVISPLLRFEGMCPMAHFINIICSVLLGPWYSLLCATLIGIIRMATMGIPPIALTGAVFGAFLSGVLYRLSKGKLLFAVLGEIVGTGIIGAIASYPVMSIFWGKTDISWLFYVPSFFCGTLIGGSFAFVFLRKLSKNGLLPQMQEMLGANRYSEQPTLLGDSLSIGALGVIFYLVISILSGIFHLDALAWDILAYAAGIVFILAAVAYYFVKRKKGTDSYAENHS